MSFRKALCIACLVTAALFSCSESPTSTNPFDDDASDETQARGSLSGYVHDPHGSALSGVSVSLVNEQLVKGGFASITNQLGFFRVNDVLAGSYEITFTLSGTNYLDTTLTMSFAIGEHKALTHAMIMAFPVTVTLDAQSPFTHPTRTTVVAAFGRDSSSLPTPQRTGYRFDGWWTEQHYRWNGSMTQPEILRGLKISNYFDVNIVNAAVLYAHWIPEDGGNWTDNGTTLTDPDGNLYTTVVIGSQRWTVENLRTTRYADGTMIPYVSNSSVWNADDINTLYCGVDICESEFGFYRVPREGTVFKAECGAQYNWWVVDTQNEHRIAPDGWRVPTDADWRALMASLGGENVAGGKMKSQEWVIKVALGENLPECHTEWALEDEYMFCPDGSATNESGFTALQDAAQWWSSTLMGWDDVYYRRLHDGSGSLENNLHTGKRDGLYVRLVRDLN